MVVTKKARRVENIHKMPRVTTIFNKKIIKLCQKDQEYSETTNN